MPMFNYEPIERSNFLTWIRLSTREEIMDALRKNREKMRYLLDKYDDEIEGTYTAKVAAPAVDVQTGKEAPSDSYRIKDDGVERR